MMKNEIMGSILECFVFMAADLNISWKRTKMLLHIEEEFRS
jgi:hypothetical protein